MYLMFEEMISRIRFGYPIGEGYRLSSRSRDELVLFLDGNSFDVFVETLADGGVLICANQTPRNYKNSEVELPCEVRDKGLNLLKKHFEKNGKRAVIQ